MGETAKKELFDEHRFHLFALLVHHDSTGTLRLGADAAAAADKSLILAPSADG